MKVRFLSCLAVMAAVACALLFVSTVRADDKKPMNVIVIMVDDLGWADVGCMGSEVYQTPNVDGLAKAGMRFTQGYASCAVCSPTRASLQTGCYPSRVGITDWIRSGFQNGQNRKTERTEYRGPDRNGLILPVNPTRMEVDEPTLADVLSGSGYECGFIGKWHLGQEGFYPEQQGYTFNAGGCDLGQPPGYFDPYFKNEKYQIPNLPSRKEGEYLTDREGDEAVRFITMNKDKPFFLCLCHYAVHTPLQAKKEMVQRYKEKIKGMQAKGPVGQKNATYAAMVESFDEAAGKIVAALKKNGLTDNTAIIFTSDNGGLHPHATSNAPLRSGKGHPYEGGIRVPFIISWPGVTTPGSTCDEPIITMDLFPTILEMTGVEAGKRPEDRPLDGKNLSPLLRQCKDKFSRDDALFWYFPHNRIRSPYAIIRDGDWKMIKWYDKPEFELYNLADDLAETTDVAAKHPEKVKQLDTLLSKRLKQTNSIPIKRGTPSKPRPRKK